ncbi:MAG: putative 2-polyprenyl-6-methoxyphenol 4-hydroxylase [Rickettsiales bacterium]|jgi:2-octaprenyl-6-methoxyphenol hydroxylase|nr:putative 2-polyprenyl-6-methoxyphenol 4-hydroxylase [Rickettsiales bacterium]
MPIPSPFPSQTDVIIIGGGLVGLTAACALGQAGFSVVIIEQRDPHILASQTSDGRASALALGSKRFLESIGLWESLKPYAGPINDIRVVDNNSSLFLHFDFETVSDEPMGYMVENHVTLKSLLEELAGYPNVRLIAPMGYKNIERSSARASVTLSSGEILHSRLLLAADGRESRIRNFAGIDVTRLDYQQVGIVCNVHHEEDHHGTAIEHFMPSGPFAILPMQGGHHSSLVWTEKASLAPSFLALDKEALTAEIGKRFGNFLGKLTLSSPVFSYPLELVHAKHYTAERLILLGDAAHGIHPIAGQGYNLGLRDVETLIPALTETRALGLDIGSLKTRKCYEQNRQFDTVSMTTMTDLLNRLFSNRVPALQIVRRVGLAAVNEIPSLKKFFMRRAMGL